MGLFQMILWESFQFTPKVHLTNRSDVVGEDSWKKQLAKRGIRLFHVGKFEVKLRRIKSESSSRSQKVSDFSILHWKLSNFNRNFPSLMLIFPTQTFKLETLEFIVFNCHLQFQVAHNLWAIRQNVSMTVIHGIVAILTKKEGLFKSPNGLIYC